MPFICLSIGKISIMRVTLLAPENSTHTIRWVKALAERGLDVHLVTAHPVGATLGNGITVHHLPVTTESRYILNSPFVWYLLQQINPNLLHIHQASGYGLLGTLSGFSPRVLSVWGADVYDIPSRSAIHREIIRWNLRSADWVCSTSEVMAKQTQSLQNVDNLTVTPFGVDTDRFAPARNRNGNDGIIIGTVKSLHPKCGIDVLIRSFQMLLDRLPSSVAQRSRLLIVGGGPQRSELEDLSCELEIDQQTTFTGSISHTEVPDHLNQLDIYAALSRRESFGVAVLEASSCGIPVVVSDVGGLPEVVRDGETGIVVESESPDEAAEAIHSLVTDPKKRYEMGKRGRSHVVKKYEWSDCVTKLLEVYEYVNMNVE